MNLTTFEKYVLGVCHDIDGLIEPNKVEVVERFEEFAARNFEGLCERHPNPGPVIAGLCGEWKKRGDQVKTDYDVKIRNLSKEVADLNLAMGGVDLALWKVKLQGNPAMGGVSAFAYALKLGHLNIYHKFFEAYVLKHPDNLGRRREDMVWYGINCGKCLIQDIPRQVYYCPGSGGCHPVGYTLCRNCFISVVTVGDYHPWRCGSI